MSPRPTLLRALRHRNYRLFVSGQLISLIGTWMQTVAESWLVYRLTGSAFLLGAVGFANRIPVFLFSSVGGAIADRYNRHHIVIATQAASMLLGIPPCGADPDPCGAGLAPHGHRHAAGYCERLRHPGPAGVRGRAGCPGRSAERHRLELFHVQRGPGGGSGGRGGFGGSGGRRLVFLCQRGQLHRGYRWTVAHAGPADYQV